MALERLLIGSYTGRLFATEKIGLFKNKFFPFLFCTVLADLPFP